MVLFWKILFLKFYFLINHIIVVSGFASHRVRWFSLKCLHGCFLICLSSLLTNSGPLRGSSLTIQFKVPPTSLYPLGCFIYLFLTERYEFNSKMATVHPGRQVYCEVSTFWWNNTPNKIKDCLPDLLLNKKG